MKYLSLVLGALFLVTGLQAEKVCESCILRQQSHKDDIKNGPYYEDTGFFTMDTLEGTPLAPAQKTAPAPKKQVKTPSTVNNNPAK
ncbi:MAG: hypothetical protein WC222_07555 [Parachlamydiales bacterium]|jgi:hypothetical protein